MKQYSATGRRNHGRPLKILLDMWDQNGSTCGPTPWQICGNKMPTRCNRCFLLQILLLAQHVSGTTMPIIRSSRVLYRWLLPVVFGAWFSSCRYCGAEGYVSGLRAAARNPQPSAPHHTDNLKTKAPNTTGSNHLYNTLELLMMGIIVPETCWASNKICNKKHLLHLVGILFPDINDDARSKSLQIHDRYMMMMIVYCVE